MDYLIVGTAGHIDHGKSLLVKALTGVDTDRLQEEKARGISIELGFAPLVLPGGQKVGLVDVPGHERFVKQMLAGAAGMDLVLLLVAADEGVMPQTREHLEIIDLLRLPKGIAVISKIDLVDKEWRELMCEEVREVLKGTVLEEAPLVEVSAHSGEGMAHLLTVLEKMLAQTPARPQSGAARLPVDRVFSITGFGTVVTGTLWSGRVKQGDSLQILPGGSTARLRHLQVHGQTVSAAAAGQRVALNVAGGDPDHIKRGAVLAAPGYLVPSHRIDAELQLLSSAPAPLLNRTRVRLHLATSELLGRVVLLDRDRLKPGEKCLVQFALEQPAAADKSDRFVIRRYSPLRTIGGGTVIDPAPPRHKRFRKEVLSSLTARLQGCPEDIMLDALQQGAAPRELSELARLAGQDREEACSLLERLFREEKIIWGETEGLVLAVDQNSWKRIRDKIKGFLEQYHARYPLRPGISREELRTRLFSDLSGTAFKWLLQEMEALQETAAADSLVFLKGFQPGPRTERGKKVLDFLEKELEKGGFQPPTLKELCDRQQPGEEEIREYLSFLQRQGTVLKVAEELYFHCRPFQKAKELVENHLREHGAVQLGEVRDILQSSRKYVLPLLEYFDRMRFTRRLGDKRVLCD